MSDPFRYIFRFCCDPGFNDEAEMQALKRYVREAHIDDVAVFANVQELNTGHMTREEQDVYLRLMERVRDLLSGMGVTFSINHWHSVMHADLGKRMDPALDFRPMVDVVRLPPVREVAKAHRRPLCALCAAGALHPVGGGRLPPAQPRAADLGRVLL